MHAGGNFAFGDVRIRHNNLQMGIFELILGELWKKFRDTDINTGKETQTVIVVTLLSSFPQADLNSIAAVSEQTN